MAVSGLLGLDAYASSSGQPTWDPLRATRIGQAKHPGPAVDRADRTGPSCLDDSDCDLPALFSEDEGGGAEPSSDGYWREEAHGGLEADQDRGDDSDDEPPAASWMGDFGFTDDQLITWYQAETDLNISNVPTV